MVEKHRSLGLSEKKKETSFIAESRGLFWRSEMKDGSSEVIELKPSDSAATHLSIVSVVMRLFLANSLLRALNDYCRLL